MSSTNFEYEGRLLNYYEVLGVARNATMDEIKRAYRQLALKHHPDKGGDQATFKKVGHAYYILSDMQRREDYDDEYGYNAAPESESESESDGEAERERERERQQRELDEELENETNRDRDPQRYWYNRAAFASRRGKAAIARTFMEKYRTAAMEDMTNERVRRNSALRDRRLAAEAQAAAFAAAQPAMQAEFDELLADLAKPAAPTGESGSAAEGGGGSGGADDAYLRKRRAQWAEAKRRQRARKNAADIAETEAAVRAALASRPSASLFNDLAAQAARPEATWQQANAVRAMDVDPQPRPKPLPTPPPQWHRRIIPKPPGYKG